MLPGYYLFGRKNSIKMLILDFEVHNYNHILFIVLFFHFLTTFLYVLDIHRDIEPAINNFHSLRLLLTYVFISP